MSTCESDLVELPQRRAAVVRGQVAAQEISSFMGDAFQEVAQAVGRHGQRLAGMPFARYHVTADGFDVEAGFPVQAAVAEGRVESVTLPGGLAVRTLHRGPYGDVAAAYEAGQRWMEEHGYEPSADPWESYLDEPDVPDPRTEVLMPCRRRPS